VLFVVVRWQEAPTAVLFGNQEPAQVQEPVLEPVLEAVLCTPDPRGKSVALMLCCTLLISCT